MKTRDSFLALIAELEGDFRELGRVGGQNQRAWRRIQSGALDLIDWGALGFTIHSLYGILENYFHRISKFFENDLPSERWHKALVDRMAIEIPGVRPALISDEGMKRRAQELLRFRHRFRNLYGEDLDPAKTADVQKAVLELMDAFPNMHSGFLSKLRAIAGGME